MPKRTLDPTAAAKIADLEAHNHHNEAAIALCEALGQKWLAGEVRKLMNDQRRLGYMPHEHIARRSELMTPLWDAIR